MNLHYDWDGNPISMMEWAKIIQMSRTVGKDKIGPFLISTVFLGLNHNWSEDGPPLIFETMIFGPEDSGLDQSQWRYSTLQQAKDGHENVRKALQATWEKRKWWQKLLYWVIPKG